MRRSALIIKWFRDDAFGSLETDDGTRPIFARFELSACSEKLKEKLTRQDTPAEPNFPVLCEFTLEGLTWVANKVILPNETFEMPAAGGVAGELTLAASADEQNATSTKDQPDRSTDPARRPKPRP